jgi:hypothetical protein
MTGPTTASRVSAARPGKTKSTRPMTTAMVTRMSATTRRFQGSDRAVSARVRRWMPCSVAPTRPQTNPDSKTVPRMLTPVTASVAEIDSGASEGSR